MGIAEYLYVGDHRKDLKDHIREELVGIADIKARDIGEWRKERLSDAGFIFNSNSIAHDLQILNPGAEDAEAASRMRNWMTSMLRNGHYRNIRCLSPEGKELLWLPPGARDGAKKSLLQQASTQKAIVFSDLFMNPQNQPEIHYHHPDVCDFMAPATPAGYIQLTIDPQDELFGIVQKWSRPSKSAEGFAGRQGGK